MRAFISIFAGSRRYCLVHLDRLALRTAPALTILILCLSLGNAGVELFLGHS